MTIKVYGNNTGTVAEVQADRALLVNPNGYGQVASFSKSIQSGIMAAGLAANANICHFRNSSEDKDCLIRRVSMNMWNSGTGFTAGIVSFRMFVARFNTGVVTAGVNGTISGNNGKLRTSMDSPEFSDIRATTGVTAHNGSITVSNTAALTSAAATLDTDPIAGITFGVPATASIVYLPPTDLIKFDYNDHPLVLREFEGFTIQATVPATGTWGWRLIIEWDEAESKYNHTRAV